MKSSIAPKKIATEIRWSMVDPVILVGLSHSPKYRHMVPFGNFSALTQACVELLMKVDSRQRTLGPRITEVVSVTLVVASVSLNCKTLLEFEAGSPTVWRVAFPT